MPEAVAENLKKQHAETLALVRKRSDEQMAGPGPDGTPGGPETGTRRKSWPRRPNGGPGRFEGRPEGKPEGGPRREGAPGKGPRRKMDDSAGGPAIQAGGG